MGRLTQKHSTILISVGDKTKVYHSVEEVPPRLLERLIETTHGTNSATILIADKAGRDELVRAIREQKPELTGRLSSASLDPIEAKRRRFVLTWAGLGRLLLLGSAGYIAWILLTLR